jgi:hypothetical protein
MHKVMESTIDYMARMYKELAKEYRHPAGIDVLVQKHIALEISERLLCEGKKPSIMLFAELNNSEEDYVPLVPTRYLGEVVWDYHFACICNGVVYDPLLREPAPLDDYSQKAFGRWVDCNIQMTTPEIIKKIFS